MSESAGASTISAMPPKPEQLTDK